MMYHAPSLTEAEIFNCTLELAYEENIADWAAKVSQ